MPRTTLTEQLPAVELISFAKSKFTDYNYEQLFRSLSEEDAAADRAQAEQVRERLAFFNKWDRPLLNHAIKLYGGAIWDLENHTPEQVHHAAQHIEATIHKVRQNAICKGLKQAFHRPLLIATHGNMLHMSRIALKL